MSNFFLFPTITWNATSVQWERSQEIENLQSGTHSVRGKKNKESFVFGRAQHPKCELPNHCGSPYRLCAYYRGTKLSTTKATLKCICYRPTGTGRHRLAISCVLSAKCVKWTHDGKVTTLGRLVVLHTSSP